MVACSDSSSPGRGGEVLAEHGGPQLRSGRLREGVVLGDSKQCGDLRLGDRRTHNSTRRWGVLPMRRPPPRRIIWSMTNTSPRVRCQRRQVDRQPSKDSSRSSPMPGRTTTRAVADSFVDDGTLINPFGTRRWASRRRRHVHRLLRRHAAGHVDRHPGRESPPLDADHAFADAADDHRGPTARCPRRAPAAAAPPRRRRLALRRLPPLHLPVSSTRPRLEPTERCERTWRWHISVKSGTPLDAKNRHV